MKKIIKILSLSILVVYIAVPSVFSQSNLLQALQKDTRNIADTVLPSVVKIDVSSTVEVSNRENFFFFFDNPFNGQDDEDNNVPKREYSQQGLGSGIIVRKGNSNTYYVLTNEHVINNADEVLVSTYDGEQYSAQLVGVDVGRDLAIISFESKKDHTVAKLGDSDSLNPGDIVFAIGNPYDFQFSITFGIISALNRESRGRKDSGNLNNYIQTDAAVNRGNSGGPLVNINGEVIGINTWIYSESGGGNEGLSFAVPINNAILSIDSVIEKGKVEYGWLGVNISDVVFRQMSSLGQKEGAFVVGVYPNSPADKAGVRPGDIIYAVDNKNIKDTGELITGIASLPPNKKVTVDLYRSNVSLSLSIRLGDREEATSEEAEVWPGFKISEITEGVKNRIQVSEGVIITFVYPESIAQTAGLRAGDVIEKINNVKIRNLKDFYSNLNLASKNEVLFRLKREGASLTIGLEK